MKIRKIGKRVKTPTQTVDGGDVDDMRSRVKRLEKDVAEIKGALTELSKSMTAIQERINHMPTTAAMLAAIAAALVAGVGLISFLLDAKLALLD